MAPLVADMDLCKSITFPSALKYVFGRESFKKTVGA